jgi:hypothetical protein
MLLKEAEKNPVTGARQIVVLFLLLTADSTRREHFTKCDGMLAVHNVRMEWHIIEFVEIQPTISTIHLCCSYRIAQYVCILYNTRTAVVSLLHSFCARISIIRVTRKTCVLGGFRNCRSKTLLSQQRVYSRTNHASLVLRSPILTLKMCGYT